MCKNAQLFSATNERDFAHKKTTISQTPEGYISKDIYILYPIQKNRKRIFPYHCFERAMLRDMIS
jgi:hypothetical protein